MAEERDEKEKERSRLSVYWRVSVALARAFSVAASPEAFPASLRLRRRPLRVRVASDGKKERATREAELSTASATAVAGPYAGAAGLNCQVE